MADIKALLADPEFKSLSPAGQRALANRIDPELGGLSDVGFQDFVKRVSGSFVPGMEKLGGSAPGPVKPELPGALRQYPGWDLPPGESKTATGLDIAVKSLAAPITGLLHAPGEIVDWFKRGGHNAGPSGGFLTEDPVGMAYGNAAMALAPTGKLDGAPEPTLATRLRGLRPVEPVTPVAAPSVSFFDKLKSRPVQEAFTRLLPKGKEINNLRKIFDPPVEELKTKAAPAAKPKPINKAEREANARALDPYTYPPMRDPWARPRPSQRLPSIPPTQIRDVRPRRSLPEPPQPMAQGDAYYGSDAAPVPTPAPYTPGLPAPPQPTPGPYQGQPYTGSSNPMPMEYAPDAPIAPRPVATPKSKAPTKLEREAAAQSAGLDPYSNPPSRDPWSQPGLPAPPRIRDNSVPRDQYGNVITPGSGPMVSGPMDFEVPKTATKAGAKEAAPQGSPKINPTAAQVEAEIAKRRQPPPAMTPPPDTPPSSGQLATERLAAELKQEYAPGTTHLPPKTGLPPHYGGLRARIGDVGTDAAYAKDLKVATRLKSIGVTPEQFEAMDTATKNAHVIAADPKFRAYKEGPQKGYSRSAEEGFGHIVETLRGLYR